MGKVVRVAWTKSGIGYSQRQKATLRALGFSRLGQVIDKPDSPALRGMLARVRHLVRVEEIDS